MKKRKLKKPVNHFSLVLALVLLLGNSCEKSPFDYRNKWVGDWQLSYDVYTFGDFSEDTYTEKVRIEKTKDGEMGKALEINGFTFGVDKEGSLSMRQGKGQDVSKVGNIDKDKLNFEVNTSINSPGVLYTVTGTRIN